MGVLISILNAPMGYEEISGGAEEERQMAKHPSVRLAPSTSPTGEAKGKRVVAQ